MLGLITYSLLLLALIVGAWLRPAVGVAAVLCLYGLKRAKSSTTLLADHRQFTNYAVFFIALVGLIRAARIVRAHSVNSAHVMAHSGVTSLCTIVIDLGS